MKNTQTIKNSNHEILFIQIDNKNKFINCIDSQRVLNTLYKEENIDISFISAVFSGRRAFSKTIIKDLYYLPKGYEALITFSIDGLYKVVITQSFKMQYYNCSFADLFCKQLESQIDKKGINNIAVSFSAGLDSSSILFSLCDIKKRKKDWNVIAFCWYSDEISSQDDLLYSENVCIELGVPFYKMPICYGDLFKVVDNFEYSPIIDTSILFMDVEKKIQDELLKLYENEDYLIINGHGGDHLFLDPIPAAMIFNKPFFSNLNRIQRYSALNYIQLIKEATFSYLENKNSTDFEIQRTHAIYEACSNNCWSKDTSSSVTTLYPFTELKVIEASLSYKLDDILDSKYSRYAYRMSMYDRFGHSIFLRNSKGHMTGSYQLAIKHNQIKLLDLIQDGFLVKNNIIDMNSIKNIFEKVSLGYTGFPYILGLVLSIEIFIEHLMKKGLIHDEV